MPNGGLHGQNNPVLHIKGIKVIALPDEKPILTKEIGGDKYRHTLNVLDIPEGEQFLTIEIDYEWV